VDDLFNATLLPGTGGKRRFLQSLLALLLRQPTGGDEPAEGIGSAIENV
jgi:hypothetical protein